MKLEELGSIPLFAGLSPSQLERLAKLFEAVAFPAGAPIFTAGDRASRFYVVRSGEVIIRYHPYDGGSLDIATIEPDGAFGWSAAFGRSYYTSSAICRIDVAAFTVRAHDLNEIMADDPQFARALLEYTSQSARSRFDSLSQQVIRLLKHKHL
jgi:CRP-like cAMP-binding protein